MKKQIIEQYQEPDYTYEEIVEVFVKRMRTVRKEGLGMELRVTEAITDENGMTIGVKQIPASLIIYKIIPDDTPNTIHTNPEEEYRDLCEKMGGKKVKLTLGLNACMNPFDL